MPFASQAQQRFAFGTGQPWAKRWADETDFSKLPKRVRRVRSRRVKGCTCGDAVTTKGEQIAPGITRIRGNLCNVHGKYGPCDKGLSGKKPKGKKPRAAAKPKKPVKTPEQRQQERTAQQAQNRADVLSKMNIAPDGQAALDALRGGEQPDPAAIARGGFEEAGLVERARDGSYRLTASGRSMLGAADAGDVGRAGSTLSSARDRTTARTERVAASQERKRQVAARRAARAAKKPKAGGGGSAEKPAAAAGPKAAPAPAPAPDAKRGQNREQVRQTMADQDAGLAPAGFDNLMKLSEGAAPNEQGATALIGMGLAERGGDGTLRLTPSARAAVNASNRGDAKAAIDAISRATDRRSAQQEAAGRRATADTERRKRAEARAAARAESAANRDKRRRRKEMQTLKAGNPGDYLVVEDRDKPSTWHLQVKRNGKVDHHLLGAAWAALHGGYRGNKYAGPQKGEALSKLRALYASEKMPLPSEKEYQQRTEQRQHVNQAQKKPFAHEVVHASSIPPPFTVFKDASGADRWVSISSTAYKDRDQEIVSTKALEGTVALADASGYRGPLRFWHVPGVEIGDCDFQATAQDGRFLIESGTFRSPVLAAAVKERASGYQVSIGFTHPAHEPDQNGVFSHIAIFERSLVPKGRASNPFTQVATKESRMLTTEKAAALKELLGGDQSLLDSLLGQVATTDKAAQAAGTTYKDDATPDIRAIIREEIAIALKGFTPAAEQPEAEEVVTKDDGVGDIEAMADEGGMGVDTMADEGMQPDDLLSPAEIQAIAQQTAQVLLEALMPHLGIGQKMDEVKSLLGGMAGSYAKKDTELAEVKKELETVKGQVADLNGSQPRILSGGFRASQSPKTVTDDAKLKEAIPQVDPVTTSFTSWLTDMGIGS